MKNISTGFGLCIVGLGIAAWPVLDRLMPQANAVGVGSVAPAVAALAQNPPAPTIVWYGTEYNYVSNIMYVVRAWSDGKMELKMGAPNCNANCVLWQNVCGGGCPDGQFRWVVINDPSQGLTYRSDINFDSKVDGADLGTLLADWGDAPRQDIPPSDCPLNLVNP
jgi:hypothetical protein